MTTPDVFSLLDEVPCGFLSFTEDGRIVRVNATLRNLLGYGRDELEGRPLATLLTLPSRVLYQTHLFPLIRLRGRADEVSLALRPKEGAEVSVLLNAVRRPEGEEVVIDCVLFPMLRRQAYEEELREARRAAEAALEANEVRTRELKQTLIDLRAVQDQLVQEEKLAGLGRMASGIAHELRNPLSFSINFALLIEDLTQELREALGAEAVNPEEVRGLLGDLTQNARKVVEHGRRADAIVWNMMELARGSERVGVRLLKANRLVESGLTRALSGRTDGFVALLQIERAYSEASGEVEGSLEELVRVFEALIGNALDALEDKARGATAPDLLLVLRTERVGGRVLTHVIDNGGGIADAQRPRVFEPFFTTKKSGSGHVGLGLSLAYETVRDYGGTIDLTPTPGGGATLTVDLPAQEARRSFGKKTA